MTHVVASILNGSRLLLPSKLLGSWSLLLLAGTLTISSAFAQTGNFSFGVIAYEALRSEENSNDMGSTSNSDAVLREAIIESDADNLAFVVASGFKTPAEPCSDKLFFKRKELFQSAKNGLIVSLAASDWSRCTGKNGKSMAIERLNRIRDLFFEGDFSFGASKLPLIRQANIKKFRTYVENTRWDVGNMVFATVNIPANNNNFVTAAGRNNEFEDRMVADGDWLKRIFGTASQKNAAGIVLFCDGNPLSIPDIDSVFNAGNGRDGYAEIRKQIKVLASRFNGKVVLIHNLNSVRGLGANAPGTINWQGNVGQLRIEAGWSRITVDPTSPTLFELKNIAVTAKTSAP